MGKPNDIIVKDNLNGFLENHSVKLSLFSDCEFNVEINNILASLPFNIAGDYSWIRSDKKLNPGFIYETLIRY